MNKNKKYFLIHDKPFFSYSNMSSMFDVTFIAVACDDCLDISCQKKRFKDCRRKNERHKHPNM